MAAPLPKACVMGHPVAHSRSPMIHGYWLRTLGIPGAYELKDLTPEAFPDFVTHLAANGYVGGNVTVPHKEAAFRLVDRRDEASEAVGAVNTLWLENGRLMGGNSDTHGFIANLDDRAPGWDLARRPRGDPRRRRCGALGGLRARDARPRGARRQSDGRARPQASQRTSARA